MAPRHRRSEICTYLARNPNKRSDAVAKALGKDFKLVMTRLCQLEKAGRIRRMNSTNRTRDIKWSLADGERADLPPRVSYRAEENIAAMREACRARLKAGLGAAWLNEPEEATA